MSELSEAIQEMRNMRESYDQIGAAAEAYNTGKTQLAANITAKGVQASPTETLPELAEKVAAIAQESYTIDGGEMYAKQLFGVANNDIVPGYWNLYDILAQLLSDGRLVNYGGILLAEYYKGYDSLALSGAGAGGAYVVSDKDANGNFIMYTEDTTHIWATEDDGKGDRWVAYCFADEYHDFQITNTNTSPRSIFIGRKVGVISSLVNGRCSEVVVPDGNILRSFNSSGYTQQWGKIVVFRNMETCGVVSNGVASMEGLYISANTLTNPIFNSNQGGSVSSVVLKANTIGNIILQSLSISCLYVDCPIITGSSSKAMLGFNAIVSKIHLRTERVDWLMKINSNAIISKKIYVDYITNDYTKSVNISADTLRVSGVTDIELKNGWRKPINVSSYENLTEENIVNHILNRLGDNTGQSALTITLGATNLAKLTEEEKAIATNKGFTLA